MPNDLIREKARPPERITFMLDFKSTDQQVCLKLWDLVDASVEREVPDGIIECPNLTMVENDRVAMLVVIAHAEKVEQVRDSVVRWWNYHGTRLHVV